METNRHPKSHNKGNFWLTTLVINTAIALGALLSATPALASSDSTASTIEPTTTQSTDTPQAREGNSSKVITSTSSMSSVASKSATSSVNTQSSEVTPQKSVQSRVPEHHHHHRAYVNVNHVDQTGKLLAHGRAFYPTGPYRGHSYLTHSKLIPNYHFIGMGEHSLPANGVLNTHGDNGTITYVYAPEYSSELTRIQETIHYVDQYGTEFERHRITHFITFAKITNLVTGTSETYCSTTASTVDLNDSGVPVDGNWVKSDHAQFDAINTPNIEGYHPISTNAPQSSPTEISPQNVSIKSSNLDFTVRYALEKQPVTIKFIDDNTNETLFSKVIWIYYKQHSDYDPTSLINYYKRHGYTFVSSNFPTNGLDFNLNSARSKTYYIHLNSSIEPDILDDPDIEVPENTVNHMSDEVAKEPSKPLISSPIRKLAQQKITTSAPKLNVTRSKSVNKAMAYKHHINANVTFTPHQRSFKIKDSLDFWIKFRKRPSQPNPQAVFDNWSNELERIVKMNGDNDAHSELGKVLKTLSGRMLFGQKKY